MLILCEFFLEMRRFIAFLNKKIKKTWIFSKVPMDFSPKTRVITEGGAKLLISEQKVNEKGEKIETDVFYNPVQVYNRDLTILCLKLHAKELKSLDPTFAGLTIFDALSASGLRTVRFLKEIGDCVRMVYANDISEKSHEIMKKNFKENGVDLQKIVSSREDANKLLLDYREPYFKEKNKEYLKFDVIDLDPYGSCVPFIDAAVQCANENSEFFFVFSRKTLSKSADLCDFHRFKSALRAGLQ